MKYYAWSGWENKKLHFIIAPIIKVHGKSDYKDGWFLVDADEKKSIDNYREGGLAGGSGLNVDVDSLNIFDNIQDARREIIRGLYARR